MHPTPLTALLHLDRTFSKSLYAIYVQSSLPNFLLHLLELSGHGLPWILLPALHLLIPATLPPETVSTLLNLLLLLLLDMLAIVLLKPLIRRKRPHYNTALPRATLPAIDKYSFPSGHATRVCLVAAFLSHERRQAAHGLHPALASDLFFSAVLVWAAAVCASRVAMGRHHVLDVLVGVVLGFVYVKLWQPFWIGPDAASHLREAVRVALLGVPHVMKTRSFGQLGM